ncbi:MAG: M3 family metallopeptidase [Bdellovibrionales bacterium]
MFSRVLVFSFLLLSACAQSRYQSPKSMQSLRNDKGEPTTLTAPLIRYEYASGELSKLCDEAIDTTKKRLDAVVVLPAEKRNFDSTMLEVETALADFSDAITPLVFMGYVSQNEALRKEGETCEKKQGEFSVTVSTRKDLYDVLKVLVGRNAGETRLLRETLDSFEKNGLKLPAAQLAKVKDLKTQLTKLEAEFSANLNNDTSTVLYTLAELDGVPESVIARLKKTSDGLFIATTKSTDYTQIMQSAKNVETRKKMITAYQNRAAAANTALLEKAVVLRQQIAQLMGYRNWAQYRINGRMAKDDKTALTFLNGLKTKLAVRNKADITQLLRFKQESDRSATVVEIWDIPYLTYQLKKRDYTLDDEKIREYFPLDYVMSGVFDVYSELLGVRYEKVDNADVWASNVSLYRVMDKRDGQLISYFFMDLAPREGKYGHAAAFTLIMGRQKGDRYSVPISSIVANFNPPANGKPSLLNHDEVETLFHEFGHIMHQTLTKAPYASLAGTSVRQDFVEAPSQMLENWVWDTSILNKLSGHYQNTNNKLPPELLKQMMAAKDFNQGYFYTRQLFLGLFDMTIHTTAGKVDTTQVHDRLYQQIIGVKPLPGGHFAAGFGHMMGGYDAGYYGYLWSEVYAQDMFTRFENGKILDPVVGGRYRATILEKGNMVEPLQLITEFLERAPNNQAFLKKLGIK